MSHCDLLPDLAWPQMTCWCFFNIYHVIVMIKLLPKSINFLDGFKKPRSSLSHFVKNFSKRQGSICLGQAIIGPKCALERFNGLEFDKHGKFLINLRLIFKKYRQGIAVWHLSQKWHHYSLGWYIASMHRRLKNPQNSSGLLGSSGAK